VKALKFSFSVSFFFYFSFLVINSILCYIIDCVKTRSFNIAHYVLMYKIFFSWQTWRSRNACTSI